MTLWISEKAVTSPSAAVCRVAWPLVKIPPFTVWQQRRRVIAVSIELDMNSDYCPW
jgi:hypothetical protein